MKILYDHQIFSLQKYGGISRYFTQIILNLQENIQTELAIKYSDNIYLFDLKLHREVKPMFEPYRPIDKFLFGINFKGKRKLFRYLNKNSEENYVDSYSLNKKFSIEILKKQDFDVFHPTYYDDYFLPFLGNKPFVLTIHDMIHEIYPELYDDFETVKCKALLAQKASHIIAVSENTKKDIIDILGVPKNKISVIYHASSLNQNKNKVDLPSYYVLFVGDRDRYKNFLIFVRAIEPILKSNFTLKVICLGYRFSNNELDLFNLLSIRDRFINVQVDDNNLFTVYENAQALILPSYYEGFCIPILEAFQAGCPVILSNTSCFPEIAGEAAIYFEPKNIIQLRNIIEEVLNNAEKRKNFAEKGYLRFRDFSWKNSAVKTLAIYKGII